MNCRNEKVWNIEMIWNNKYALFSSPELKAQVSYSDRPLSVICPSDVCLLDLHFRLLLQNHRANCNQRWRKSSIGERDSELFIWRATPFSKGR
jgi:hypothetical protein